MREWVDVPSRRDARGLQPARASADWHVARSEPTVRNGHGARPRELPVDPRILLPASTGVGCGPSICSVRARLSEKYAGEDSPPARVSARTFPCSRHGVRVGGARRRESSRRPCPYPCVNVLSKRMNVTALPTVAVAVRGYVPGNSAWRRGLFPGAVRRAACGGMVRRPWSFRDVNADPCWCADPSPRA